MLTSGDLEDEAGLGDIEEETKVCVLHGVVESLLCCSRDGIIALGYMGDGLVARLTPVWRCQGLLVVVE